jgi:hypothetical protein
MAAAKRNLLMMEGVRTDNNPPATASSPVPRDSVSVWIYGYEFNAKDDFHFTEDELDAHIKMLVTEGYTSQKGPNVYAIFPPNTIKKIEVVKHKN